MLKLRVLKQTMKYAYLAPAHLQKAVFVMDDVYRVSTDTKLAQSNEKGSVNNDQPFENLVELRGNLTRFASQGGQPPRKLPRSLGEFFPQTLLVRSHHENKKGRSM
jgi:hypothetical protein